MRCTEYFSSTCNAGHKQSWKCGDGRLKSCTKCEREAKLAKERQEQEIDAQKKRESQQQAHLAQMDVLNAQINKERQAREDARLEQERLQAIKQKEDDLATLRAQRSTWQQMLSPSKILATASDIFSRTADGRTDGRDVKTTPDNAPSVKAQTTSQMPSSDTTLTPPGRSFPQLAESPTKKEWLRQKNIQGASNLSIDAIMDMTGLEEVKQKVLNIKTKIDVSIRQGASLKRERFNVVLLGNPGTGKCSGFDLRFAICTNGMNRKNYCCTSLRKIFGCSKCHPRRSIYRDHGCSISQ